MIFDLDRLQRRMLAIAVAVIMLLVTVEVLIAPVVHYFQSAREERDHSLHQLGKLQALVDSEPVMQQALSKIDSHPIWQHVYSGAASAELQQDFRNLVDAQQITLDSVQPVDAATAGDFDKIGLRVSFNTTIDHLGHLLLAMRAAPRTLHFENLYVTSPMSQSSGNNPVLTVRGDVIGLSRHGARP